MKEFIQIILKDYRSESYTRKEWLVYGLILPVCLGAMVWLGGLLAQL